MADPTVTGEDSTTVVATAPPNGTGGRRRAAAAGSQTRVRAALLRLNRGIEAELARRHRDARVESDLARPVPVERLSRMAPEPGDVARAVRALRRGMQAPSGTEVAAALRRAAGWIDTRRRLVERASRGEAAIDDFGFDPEWTEQLLPFFRWLYRSYWRVQTTGLQHVPLEGRALLVSNHAGVLPYDGAMIRVACFEELAVSRHARALILDQFFSLPVSSWALRRTGNTLAHPDDARRLLEEDELVLVFPEGAKGTGKLWRDRYRLQRFGRGGFVEIALRTGAPIVPVCVVGSEEIHPMVRNVEPVARLLGVPYWPLTPTFPLLGPLGAVPLPSSWRIEFFEPIDTARHGAAAADDPAVVFEIADQVRGVIQQGLYDNLQRRGGTYR